MAEQQQVVGLKANPPAPQQWVEIAHEGIETTTRVHPRSVKHWQDRGWTVVGETEAPVAPATTRAGQRAAGQEG